MTFRAIGSVQVSKLFSMLSESKRVSRFGLFSIAENNRSANHHPSASPIFYGKLCMPLCFIDDLRHLAMSQTVDESRTSRSYFSKNGRDRLCSRTDGTRLASIQMISILHVLNKALFSEQLFSYLIA